MKLPRWLPPRERDESPDAAQRVRTRRKPTWIDRCARFVTRRRDPATAKWNRVIGAAGMILGAALMAIGAGPIGLALLFLFLLHMLFATRQ